MLQQFHRILVTPKASTASTLCKTQDLILSAFESLFSDENSTTNIERINFIYEEVLGTDCFPSVSGQIEITVEQQILVNYKLIEYLIELVKQNLIHKDLYHALEEQTQKAEATIRAQIKTGQELKMYLEYMESKIQNMGKVIEAKAGPVGEGLKKEVFVLQGREAMLQKEKIGLIKKNQKLSHELEVLTQYIDSRQNSPIFSSLESSLYRNTPVKKKTAQTLSNFNDDYRIWPQDINNNEGKIQKQYEIYLNVTNVKDRYGKGKGDSSKSKNASVSGQSGQSGQSSEQTQKKRSNYFPGKI